MRFGIMAMQMNALIPAELPAAGAESYLSGFDHAGLVRQLYNQGFRLIELGGDLALFFPHSYDPGSVTRLGALKERFHLSYTVHLPLWSVEPSTPLEAVRAGSLRALVDTVKASLPLDPEMYVLHATGALAAEFYQMRLPDLAKGLILRQFQAGARHSLEALLEKTGIPSRRLAVETVEFPLDLTLELAEALDLSVCLDTGHVLAGFAGPVSLWEALERCLPRLGEVHLHDAPAIPPGGKPGYGLDHQALGKGDLDLSRLLHSLEKAAFAGPIIFELSVAEARASLEVVRTLRPEWVE